MEIGAKQLGAGCPTGPAMPPGRWFRLGGVGASAHPAHLQSVLPVYREWHGGGGLVSGSFSAGLPYAGQLPFGTRGLRNLDDQCYKEFVDRSLPANQARPHYRFAGRCYAGGREQQSSARRPDELALLGELSMQVQTALTKLSPELREAVIFATCSNSIMRRFSRHWKCQKVL